MAAVEFVTSPTVSCAFKSSICCPAWSASNLASACSWSYESWRVRCCSRSCSHSRLERKCGRLVSALRQQIRRSLYAAPCLPDFVELELCADQTARELVHLSLLLSLTFSELILHSCQLIIGWLQDQTQITDLTPQNWKERKKRHHGTGLYLTIVQVSKGPGSK